VLAVAPLQMPVPDWMPVPQIDVAESPYVGVCPGVAFFFIANRKQPKRQMTPVPEQETVPVPEKK